MYLTNIFNPSLFHLTGQQESCHPDFHFFAIQTAKFLRSGLPLFCYPDCKILAFQYRALFFRVYHFCQNYFFRIMINCIHTPCPFHVVLPFQFLCNSLFLHHLFY